MKNKAIAGRDYLEFVADLKARIASARLSAARAVNRNLILLYWDIGKAIVEKQKTFGWGESVVELLARDLQEAFPGSKGFSFQPEHLAEQAEETLKSSYNLEFLGIGRAMRERELEDRLIERLLQFILELGYGFCFVGRQHRLTLGRKEYFIDLLFYHRFLKALVAIELKVGPFASEHAGQMDFYLNLLNHTERGPDDHPSIGIILCAEKDNLEVEFALKTKTNPRVTADVPADAGRFECHRGRRPRVVGGAIPVRTRRLCGKHGPVSIQRP